MHQALRFCGSDHLLGVSWILARGWSNPMLDPVIKNDLLIRLTDLPYWIDESGSFDPLDSCSYDYWTEDDQLSWLSGGYLVGKCVFAA